MAFASLILGTLSIIFSFIFNWWAWYITVSISVLGIVLGIFGKLKSRFVHVSAAGIILSIIGAVLTILLIIAYSSIAEFFSGMLH